MEEIHNIINNNPWVISDFGAPSWCRPCAAFQPHFDAAAESMAGISFVHVDVDNADKDLINHFKIMGVPTVLFFSGNSNEWINIESRQVQSLIRELNGLTSTPQLV